MLEISKVTCSRILLVKLRSIGDTVLMTPVLEALKNWSSNVKISVVIESLSAPILESNPLVDKLFVINRTNNLWLDFKNRAQLITNLRRENYDIAFNMHGGTTAAWICRLSGAKKCIGYSIRSTRFLLTDTVPSPQELLGKKDIHCVEQQLAILKYCGIPIPFTPKLSVFVEEKIIKKVNTILLKNGITSPYAVIHPAATFSTKQWSHEKFAQVINYIHSRHIKVVITGTYSESAAVESIFSLVDEKEKVFLAHEFSLIDSIALIASCSLFIGNDSGPSHIAASFGVPQVVIFGSSNETVWQPWTLGPYKVVRKDLSCAPCSKSLCPLFPEPECIKQVTIDMVVEAIEEVLRNSGRSHSVP